MTRGAAAQAAWSVGADGWLAAARAVPSPNRDARPAGSDAELLVVHCISLPPGCYGGEGVERFFTNALDHDAHPFYSHLRGVRVSAHFLIARDGALTQFVSCRERAWHAGVSAWEGRPACNDFSIGVELEGSEFDAYTEPQYATLARLHGALCAAFPLRAVRGHSEIAPGRKSDPGPFFDWSRIARDHR